MSAAHFHRIVQKRVILRIHAQIEKKPVFKKMMLQEDAMASPITNQIFFESVH